MEHSTRNNQAFLDHLAPSERTARERVARMAPVSLDIHEYAPTEPRQDGIIRMHDAFGRPIADIKGVRTPTDIVEPRDPDADPTTFEGWEAMMERRDLDIRGGRGGSGGRSKLVPFIPHDVRLPDFVDVESHLRFVAKLTIGEIEFYHGRPGVALAVLRQEVELIVSQRTATVDPTRKLAPGKSLRLRPMHVRGLTEEQAEALRASHSGAAALASYARAKDGDRIRRREGM